MTAIQCVRSALTSNDNATESLAELRVAPLLRARAADGKSVGNHATWIAGHLAVAEGRLQKILHGTPNPVEHWKPLFDWGSTPTDDASIYPPLDELIATFKRLRGATMTYLDTLDDAALDSPTAAPAPGIPVFDKVGPTLLTIAAHQSFHLGQAAVLRRVAGLAPKFVPSAELRAF